MSRLASCMEAAAISAWLCVWIQKWWFFQAMSGWFIYTVPESMRACLRAAHSSIRSFGMPSATALAMPPISSMSLMNYTKKKKTQVWTEWLHDERLQHYCIYLCGWRLPHKNCTRHQGCKKVCIYSSISSLSWLNCGWKINSSLKQYSDYFGWKPSLLPLCPLDKPSELCYRRHPWEPPSCASPPRDRLL